MEENMIQPTQKESFKTPLIILFAIFVLYSILGYYSLSQMTIEDFTHLMSITPGGDRYTPEMIQQSFEMKQTLSVITGIGTGVTRLVAMLVISVVIFFGFNIASKRQNFKTIFKCLIYAEIVVLIQSVWAMLTTDIGNLECYNQSQVTPLSVLSLLNACNLEAYMIGVLKYISVFEVLYFGLLVYFLVKNIPDLPKSQVIRITAYCYGIILLISMIRDTLSLIGAEKLANM